MCLEHPLSSKPYRVFNKCTLTVEESPHVVFVEDDARLARKVSCDDLVDSLENIYLNDNDEGNNSKEAQDEEEEPPMDEEQPREEETPMPRAWRTSKDHPLDKVLEKRHFATSIIDGALVSNNGMAETVLLVTINESMNWKGGTLEKDYTTVEDPPQIERTMENGKSGKRRNIEIQ
ncbi:unnamed protein product [Cuscuta campestris]|uniref:Uncharacterized protein n=1 Tax=Cuscuta campestris TaxID=132261 RepID=A0A484N5X5_9ASTE|nr:unnamed protein product [Cuscuta campestris]